MLQRRPGMSAPVDWAQLRRATQREVPLREAADIQVIDRWIASLPMALLPMDSPNVRMRLGTIVESAEYKKDSVILAAGRKYASRVFVIHTGTVHITAMTEVAERSVPELEDPVDGSHVHRLGAGNVFGLAGRPTLAGSALAMTQVCVVTFDRIKLAATIQAIYEEIGRIALRSPKVKPAQENAVDELSAEGGAGATGVSAPATASTGPDYAECKQLMRSAAGQADIAAQFMSETGVFRGWPHDALIELSWFGYVIHVAPNQRCDPPPIFVRGGCLYFVMEGQVQLKTVGGKQVAATVTKGNFFGEDSLRRRPTIRPVGTDTAAKKKESKLAAAVRRTGILAAPEPYASDLKDLDGLPITTSLLVLDTQDLQLLCDYRTLNKVEEVAAVVKKARAAAAKRQSALFNALQLSTGNLTQTKMRLEAHRQEEMADASTEETWREPAGGVTARGAYQTALLRAQHRKLNPRSPRAPEAPVERFRKVEQCFADFKTGVSSAYVLLEAMPIEAMTQLQDSAKRIEEKVQSDFLVPLMENLKAQQDNQIALATARGAVGRWKAATKASTPRDWLLQLEHLLQHTGRELEAVRPAARLAKPVYDWESATGLCMEIRELITEATSLLHKLMLRKPQPAPIVVLTEEQIAALDQACEASDAAIGEEYKCLVRETAQKVGVTGATVRDYFSKKKRLVGPELVCSMDEFDIGADGEALPEPDWMHVPIGKDGLVELL